VKWRKLKTAQTARGATRMAQTEVAQRVVAQLGTPRTGLSILCFVVFFAVSTELFALL